MGRDTGIAIENNFVKGLITEATRLEVPENAATEIWDVVINSKGELVRRPGWEFEINQSTQTLSRAGMAITTYQWLNASGDEENNIIIMQVGDTLYFYEAVDPFSANLLTPTIDLNTFTPAGGTAPDAQTCYFSEGNSKVFVTHAFLESFFLTFNSPTDITATQIDPQIRDFEGLVSLASDGVTELAIDERETANIADLDPTHKYNLFNQGWHHESNAALTTWDSRTDMPSNADVWWAYKNSSGVFATAEIAKVDLGNTPAPSGHYLLNIYNEDRQTASGISTIAAVTTGGTRCETSAFFAGRLWLTDLRYTGKNSHLYYSQVITDDTMYGTMHQVNDPTVEDLSTLNAGDGGFITIPEAGVIHQIVPVQNTMAVMAANGVWLVTGSSGLAFSANDFSVVKVSTARTASSRSFVTAEAFPFWWGDDGIYSLTPDETGQTFKVTNLIDDTIREFYEAIPIAARREARGAYSASDRTIHWLYQSETPATTETLQEYDKVLTFNLREGAFIPWTISTSGTNNVKVHDVIATESANNITTNDTVVFDDLVSGTVTVTAAAPGVVTHTSHGMVDDQIVQFTTTDTLPAGLSLLTDYYLQNSTTHTYEVSLTEGGASVTTTDTGTGTHTATSKDDPVLLTSDGSTVIAANVAEGDNPGFKYLVSYDNGANADFTFAEVRLTSYLDWVEDDGTGVDFTSMVTTGYKTRGDTMRNSQAPYIHVFMAQEEGAGLLLQPVWDWANSSDSGRWGTQQQCYSTRRNNFDLNWRRLKLRGKGHTLQLKFTSETGKPFTIQGWSTAESVARAI
jgi:hypothetical protein